MDSISNFNNWNYKTAQHTISTSRCVNGEHSLITCDLAHYCFPSYRLTLHFRKYLLPNENFAVW